jgi:hypothetical protein
MLRIGKDAGTAVIDEDDMKFSSRTRFAEVGGIYRRGLSGTMTGKKTLEDSHSVIVGDNLLDAYGGYMEGGDGC